MELLNGTHLVRPNQILSVSLSFGSRYCNRYVEGYLISKRSNILRITELAVKSCVILTVLVCIIGIIYTAIYYTYFNPYT